MNSARLCWLWALLVALLGCDGASAPSPSPSNSASSSAAANSPATRAAPSAELRILAVPPGNAARGKQLLVEYQCHRCHDGTGHEPMQRDLHCVRCHQDILAGKFEAPPALLEKWQATVDYVQVVPSLEHVSERLRGDWLIGFLEQPQDVRPALLPSMPRLDIDRERARDIVAYLTNGEIAHVPARLVRADRAAGRRLLETRGCGSCHVLSGHALPTEPQLRAGEHAANRAILLAPDLYFARDRFRPDRLVEWLLDPASLKPSSAMPATGLSEREAEQIAAYLLFEPREPREPRPKPERLLPLERKVTYAEVDARVFRVTCRHCHSDADVALGEGGPGNTGGFGFAPKGLNLSSYAGINSGYKDDKGERHSIFAPTTDGTPRLVAALLARWDEERGRINPEVRGMPLGLPALDPEQIQLVESWVAQGRPR